MYEPVTEWNSDAPPEPTDFMHQLGGRLPDGQRLDGPKLLDVMEETLNK